MRWWTLPVQHSRTSPYTTFPWPGLTLVVYHTRLLVVSFWTHNCHGVLPIVLLQHSVPAVDSHPPPVIGDYGLPDRVVGVEPGEELEGVPVARRCLPVTVRPENVRTTLSDELHQLRQHLRLYKGPARQVVLLVSWVTIGLLYQMFKKIILRSI